MGIDLAAMSVADPAAVKNLSMSWDIGIFIFDLCGAPFHQDVGVTSADQAAHYAGCIWRSLNDGEFERVFATSECGWSIDDVRGAVEEYAAFCEHCGGYDMWV